MWKDIMYGLLTSGVVVLLMFLSVTTGVIIGFVLGYKEGEQHWYDGYLRWIRERR